MKNKESGFISTIILLIIAFVIMKYVFDIDVIGLIKKYFNKESLKDFDDKFVYYFRIIGEKIVDFYFIYIHPIFLKIAL